MVSQRIMWDVKRIVCTHYLAHGHRGPLGHVRLDKYITLPTSGFTKYVVQASAFNM